jgi:nitrate reductase NapAB chaperone NapD
MFSVIQQYCSCVPFLLCVIQFNKLENIQENIQNIENIEELVTDSLIFRFCSYMEVSVKGSVTVILFL